MRRIVVALLLGGAFACSARSEDVVGQADADPHAADASRPESGVDADSSPPDAADSGPSDVEGADADGGTDAIADAGPPAVPVRALAFRSWGVDLDALFLVHDRSGRLLAEVEATSRQPVELDVPSGGAVTRVIDDESITEVYFETIMAVEPGDELVFGIDPRSGTAREAVLRFDPLEAYNFYEVDFGCAPRVRRDEAALRDFPITVRHSNCADRSPVLAQATAVGLEPRYSWLESAPLPERTDTTTVVDMPPWRAPDARLELAVRNLGGPLAFGVTRMQAQFSSGLPVGSISGRGLGDDASRIEFWFPSAAHQVWLEVTVVETEPSTNRVDRLRRMRVDRDVDQVVLDAEEDFLPIPETLVLGPRPGGMQTAWSFSGVETPDAFRVQLYWPPIDRFGRRDIASRWPHWTILVPGTTTELRTPEVPLRFREFARFDRWLSSRVGVFAWDDHEYTDVKRRLGPDWRQDRRHSQARIDGEYRLTTP